MDKKNSRQGILPAVVDHWKKPRIMVTTPVIKRKPPPILVVVLERIRRKTTFSFSKGTIKKTSPRSIKRMPNERKAVMDSPTVSYKVLLSYQFSA